MSVFTEIRQNIDETSAVFWTDEHVYDAMNRAALEVFSQKPYTQLSTSTITALASSQFIPSPSALMIPLMVLDTDGRELPISSQRELEDYDQLWQKTAFTKPKCFIRWSESYWRPWPRANANYVFRVIGVPWPTEFSASVQDMAGFDPKLRRAVEMWASASLLEHSRPDLSDQYRSAGAQELNHYVVELRNRGGQSLGSFVPSHPRVAFRNGNIRINRLYI